ncbi:BOI-related E3 ubiquitin-protein ligase 1-like [Typha angustifolia]|uniref:BOI-related E3 ubiquitin-protein ligase 1-like n=1 Tax=Typha angustifolia TaxID=59011 RepID=UPI003C2BEE63
MAVAQYPSNVLFLNRSEKDSKEMELNQTFVSNGGSGNPRKRGRESAAEVAQMVAPPPQGYHVNLCSTGLRLEFEDQRQTQSLSNPILSSSSSSSSSFVFSDEIAAQINLQRVEIEKFLHAQGEQLRRTLAETRQRHYRALLCVAEEAAARRLRGKEAEVELAARRGAELEGRLARLRAESMTWQAKALSGQAAAAALHTQLQRAAAAAAEPREELCGESAPADDAESAHVDPVRVEPDRACRSCRFKPASVVVFPCRHLCLCEVCNVDSAGDDFCPVCRCVRSGSVQVFLS